RRWSKAALRADRGAGAVRSRAPPAGRAPPPAPGTPSASARSSRHRPGRCAPPSRTSLVHGLCVQIQAVVQIQPGRPTVASASDETQLAEPSGLRTDGRSRRAAGTKTALPHRVTHRHVEALIGRLATDPALRRRFGSDPAQVLRDLTREGYEL